jgi:hypothetical protein
LPDRLRYVAVPAAELFGQEIAIASTPRQHGSISAAFEHFLLENARTVYPQAGFADPQTFRYGIELNLNGQ